MQQIKNNYLVGSKPGSIFKRLLACLLDQFFISVATLPLILLSTFLYLKIAKHQDPLDVVILVVYTIVTVKWTLVIVMPLYFIYFEQSKWHATPGKRLLKLKVVNFDGTKLSLWKSFIRVFWFQIIGCILYLAPEYALAQMVFLAWFAVMLFNRQKTGMYEILSKTRVISI